MDNSKLDADLLRAAKSTNLARVMLLLDQGANVNCKDRDGQSPLRQAASKGREAICRLLLERGAEVNITDVEEVTPLHVAIESRSMATCELLINYGADVNHKANAYGQRPLNRAISVGEEAICRLLVARGADLTARDRDNRTPLHYAVRYGIRWAFEYLINECGESVHQKGPNGESLRKYALDHGQTKMAALATAYQNSAKIEQVVRDALPAGDAPMESPSRSKSISPL